MFGTIWTTTSCAECQNRQTVQMVCSCWWKPAGIWVYHWQRKWWKDHACTCLTFLGIEIDTVAEEVRLPVRKVAELHELLGGWLNRKRCTKRELLSITGKLQHAATVVRSGRTFVRRLFDLSARIKKPDHHVKLNAGTTGTSRDNKKHTQGRDQAI